MNGRLKSTKTEIAKQIPIIFEAKGAEIGKKLYNIFTAVGTTVGSTTGASLGNKIITEEENQQLQQECMAARVL